MSSSRIGQVLSVSGLLVFGGLNTITSKVQFTVESVGTNGNEPKLFEKPIWTTFTMFLAMSIVILVHHLQQFLARRKRTVPQDIGQGYTELRDKEAGLSEGKAFLYIGVPAVFDLVATGMMMAGLVFMTASIYQMLRGSIIVFGAIIYKFAFGRQMHAFHWTGVIICVCGVAFVGASSILNTESGDAGPGKEVSFQQNLVGIALVVGSQVCQAAQLVVEEKFMKEVKLPPLMIVGYEGVWGSILCILVVFPLVYVIPGHDGGRLEDTLDTLAMVNNNHSLLYLIFLYLFSCSTFNVASVSVTRFFNTVHRTMFEASRTAAIWGFGLVVHYMIDASATYGEAWLKYSWMELVGFVVLMVGQAIYGEVLRIPCFSYPKGEAQMIMSPASPN